MRMKIKNKYNKMSLYDQLLAINDNISIVPNNQSKSEEVNKAWMSSIFGFGDSYMSNNNIFDIAESNYDKQKIIRNMLKEKTIYNIQTGTLKVKNINYQAGWFLRPTVKDIIYTVLLMKKPNNKEKYNIAVVKGKDIGLAHVESQPYEIFQGASQLNALEMADVNLTQYDGIEIYINDNTQGPRQALSCAPGTFVRNYYVSNEYGSQFNALEKLSLSHINGYLIWGTSPEKITPYLKEIEMMMIPCMVYTQVEGITWSIFKYINNLKIYKLLILNL